MDLWTEMSVEWICGDVSEHVKMSMKSVDLWIFQWPCGDVSVCLEMMSVDLTVDLSVVDLSSCQ